MNCVAFQQGPPCDRPPPARPRSCGCKLDEPLGHSIIGGKLKMRTLWAKDTSHIHEHPSIEFASPAKIASLRFTGLLSDPGEHVAPNDRASSAQHDTIAIYYDAARTIYLPEGWTGGTPAELSVLVHEVVHHFQNVLSLKYECPQEREKLAYIAQDRWLALFGHSLEGDFHMDAFSLLVKTRCFW